MMFQLGFFHLDALYFKGSCQPSSFIKYKKRKQRNPKENQLRISCAGGIIVREGNNKKEWSRKKVVIPISAVIAVIAFYWTIERTFFPS